jgi:DHA1 family bicyclomycin/chloramphenicol resistance-like MFS transporter
MQLLALDLFPKRRGLASSALGTVHTSTSTISAALVVPLLWGSTLGLASGMAVFLMLGGLAFFLTQTSLWRKAPKA